MVKVPWAGGLICLELHAPYRRNKIVPGDQLAGGVPAFLAEVRKLLKFYLEMLISSQKWLANYITHKPDQTWTSFLATDITHSRVNA